MHELPKFVRLCGIGDCVFALVSTCHITNFMLIWYGSHLQCQWNMDGIERTMRAFSHNILKRNLDKWFAE